jgi:glycosyltransferase involved in cell wall biosynthesis
LLAACTVLCVPSSRESFGLVVVEAWACAKPVLAGPAEAMRELVHDGEDGFHVVQDGHQIAERLGRLLDDPALAREMGCRGRERVETDFAWPLVARRHLDAYRAAAERARRR